MPFFTLRGKRKGYVFLAEDLSLPITASVYSVWLKIVPPQKFALFEVTVPPYVPLFPDPDAFGEAFVAGMDIPARNIRLLKVVDLSSITSLPLKDTDTRYAERKGAHGPAGAIDEEEELLERELQGSGLNDDEITSTMWAMTSG